MKTVYVIPAGTQVAVSRDGGEFKPPAKLKVQLQFSEPVEATDGTMTFADGPMRLKVDRALIVVSRYDGSGGTNQFGA